MPTRIVLNEKGASPALQSRQTAVAPTTGGRHRNPVATGSDIETGNTKRRISRNASSSSTHSNNDNESPSSGDNKGITKTSRKVVTLRSSLFPGIKGDDTYRALSSEDIRASPRLLGYLFQLLASTVMLISVIKFYFQDENETETPAIWSLFKKQTEGNKVRDDLFVTISGPVFTWKLIGCFVVAGVGLVVNLFVIVCHFDTFCLPSLWQKIFRDGSRYEQILVYSMAVISGGGLHINTSPLSVGESQANVFFTTWITFFSAVLNCGVWRISAGRISLAEVINTHHRKTTYNWLWTLFFAITCAGALCTLYSNRKYFNLYFRGENIVLTQRDWIIAMSVLWGLALICFLSLILNHFLKKSCEVRVCGGSIVLFGWRQTEGLVALAVAGFYFWFVFTYTGGNGFINGLSNLYFGSWGAFINSVFLLSTWLRENKSIDFVRKEEEERVEHMARSIKQGR